MGSFDKMGVHNIGSRVSVKDETLNLNAVPSSARNKVFRRVKFESKLDLVRDVLAECNIFAWLLFPLGIFYIIYRIIYRLRDPSTVKFTMVETDILQVRLRGHFRCQNSENIELFTDGRQNDVDLAKVSLTWHMKVISDFKFIILDYYNGDEDAENGLELSLARKITIDFDEDYKRFKLSYQTYEEHCLCYRKPFCVYYSVDTQLTKQSAENLRQSQVMQQISESDENLNFV